MKYQTIRDADVKDKTVLVRVDYNVPLDNGKITDDLRIRASLPTLEYLLEAGAKTIVLISHLGRPEGKKNSDLTLSPVAERLQKLLPKQQIDFCDLPENGEKIQEKSKAKILLLENLRFNPGEEENSAEFIRNVIEAADADIYVQDGFAVVHRAHASTDAVAKYLPVYMGLLLEKEVINLGKVAENPEKPVLLIIGGSKVEDKEPLIEKFVKKQTE